MKQFLRGDDSYWPEALAAYRRNSKALSGEALSRLFSCVEADHYTRLDLEDPDVYAKRTYGRTVDRDVFVRPDPSMLLRSTGRTTRQLVQVTVEMRMHPDSPVWVVGSRNQTSTLQKMCEKLGLGPQRVVGKPLLPFRGSPLLGHYRGIAGPEPILHVDHHLQ